MPGQCAKSSVCFPECLSLSGSEPERDVGEILAGEVKATAPRFRGWMPRLGGGRRRDIC